MKIHQGIHNLEPFTHTVLTIGTFDGIHLGHQKIIATLRSIAQEKNYETAVFTFYPHPRKVIHNELKKIQLIYSQEEKMAKLEKLGIDHVVVQAFTPEFAEITATEFVEEILLKRLKVKTIVVGYDHQFGKNREGNIAFLKQMASIHDFEVLEISAQEVNENNVSSSKIRIAIEEGNIEAAASYLGEAFSLKGEVVTGKQLGRTIGFPTANIRVDDPEKIIPRRGVYACKAQLADGRCIPSIVNIGIAPTVDTDGMTKIEAHLIDFQGDLYGQSITLDFLASIRDEKKFDNVENLIQQIKQDEVFARQYFSIA